MNLYSYSKELETLWNKGIKTYQSGTTDPNQFFNEPEVKFLTSIGQSTQEVFDFVEDFVRHGEPDFATFALCVEARRHYFFAKQKRIPTKTKIDMAKLPAKTDAVRGIVWLPRLLPKALAKLRGEMPAELMFCCGGDRNFFKDNNIHPAEFLRIVDENEQNPEKVYDWVEERRNEAP